MKTVAGSLLVALGISVVADANADRGRHGRHHSHGVGVSLVIGAPALYYPAPYYRPYYYGPAYYPYYPSYYPPVVIREQPTVYVEQAPAVAPGPSTSGEAYWYYCPNSRAYYPYVSQCAGPWQRVAPQPPPAS